MTASEIMHVLMACDTIEEVQKVYLTNFSMFGENTFLYDFMETRKNHIVRLQKTTSNMTELIYLN